MQLDRNELGALLVAAGPARPPMCSHAEHGVLRAKVESIRALSCPPALTARPMRAAEADQMLFKFRKLGAALPG